MKEIIIFILVLLFLHGCKNDNSWDEHVEDNLAASNKKEVVTIDELVNNELSYEELTTKIYRKEEIMIIYMPWAWRNSISDFYTFEEITWLIDVEVVRSYDAGYYMVFKMEHSTLYAFVTDYFRVGHMFNLPHIPIDSIEKLEPLKGKSINQVVKTDPSTLLLDDATVSDHILRDSTQIMISYKKNIFGTFVESVEEIGIGFHSAKEYIDKILPIDLPEYMRQ